MQEARTLMQYSIIIDSYHHHRRIKLFYDRTLKLLIKISYKIKKKYVVICFKFVLI
jgi:hypothetical protein